MDSTEDRTLKSTSNLLQYTYGLVPIIAGLDKFFNLLTNWTVYLHPVVPAILHIPGHTFMRLVGVIEIIAGIIIFVRPRVGALIVMLWLICISLNLILNGYFDIAIRDLTMAIGAFTFYRLRKIIDFKESLFIP